MSAERNPSNTDHIAIPIQDPLAIATSSSSPARPSSSSSNKGVYDVPDRDGTAGAQKDTVEHPLKTDASTARNNNKDQAVDKVAATAAFERDAKSFHSYDDKLLARAIADAGRWAYGTVLVEMWVMNDERTLLFRPEAGYYVDPVFHQQCDKDCPLCRLTDRRRDDYLPPVPLTPGEGLPGILWTETGQSYGTRSWFGSQQSKARRRLRSDTTSKVYTDATTTSNVKHVVWREVQALVQDPDQAWNPRLQHLGSLGLGYVAAVEFSMYGQTGIVVFMAREGVDLDRLRSDSNENYLRTASDLAGAAYALRGPRRRVVDERRAELDAVLRRVRTKILAIKRMGISLEQLVKDHAAQCDKDAIPKMRVLESRCAQICQHLQARTVSTLRKTLGGGVQPPPSLSWTKSFHTTFGCFLTLLMVTRLNVHVTATYGRDYSIVLGPFGAFMTLIYGLTAAPASQPRNAILGQTFSITIAILIGKIDEMDIWLRQSLATALAVGVMTKLGITHPPAGAAALIYSSGNFGWGNLLFMIIGNIVAIGSASLINNWFDDRQYPSYWGVPALEDMVGRRKEEAAKKAS